MTVKNKHNITLDLHLKDVISIDNYIDHYIYPRFIANGKEECKLLGGYIHFFSKPAIGLVAEPCFFNSNEWLYQDRAGKQRSVQDWVNKVSKEGYKTILINCSNVNAVKLKPLNNNNCSGIIVAPKGNMPIYTIGSSGLNYLMFNSSKITSLEASELESLIINKKRKFILNRMIT